MLAISCVRWPELRHRAKHNNNNNNNNGARGGAIGWGTALQAWRSRVRFPMVSLEFFIDIILPAELWPWGGLKNISWRVQIDCLEILEPQPPGTLRACPDLHFTTSIITNISLSRQKTKRYKFFETYRTGDYQFSRRHITEMGSWHPPSADFETPTIKVFWNKIFYASCAFGQSHDGRFYYQNDPSRRLRLRNFSLQNSFCSLTYITVVELYRSVFSSTVALHCINGTGVRVA